MTLLTAIMHCFFTRVLKSRRTGTGRSLQDRGTARLLLRC